MAHELRPFFRQYFGDDNAFTPRIVIDWILQVSGGKSGYFAFDKFDTTGELHNGLHQMVHSPTPLNVDEMQPEYPVLDQDRKHPFQFQSYFYRSAMSLRVIGFEATSAMAAACADSHAPFNTGKGGAVHPIPLSVLFGKTIYKALPVVVEALEKHKLRDKVRVLASAKLYAPHVSAKAMALGADAVGNARSVMIAGGCIRVGLCSGEYGTCPVGLATMKKKNQRAYAQAWDAKVAQIGRYLKARNKGLIQVASIVGVDSPSKLVSEHVAPGA